ncbi:MAG: hypothetical protein ACK55I_39810, partial [bacterium]
VEVPGLLALAAVLRMLAQVVVRAVGHAFELAEVRVGEGELVFDVAHAGTGLRVVRQFVAIMLTQAQVGARQADRLPPAIALRAPPGIPLVRAVGPDEELDLH